MLNWRRAVAAMLAAVLAGAASAGAQTSVDRPDLDDAAFVKQLGDLDMKELLKAWEQDHPVGQTTDLDSLVQTVDSGRAAMTAGKADPAAVARFSAALRQLVRFHGKDARSTRWRVELAQVLVDSEIQPRSNRIAYQIIPASELTQQASLLAEVRDLAASARKSIDDEVNKLAETRDRRQIDKLRAEINEIRIRLGYCETMRAFYSAQLAWAMRQQVAAEDVDQVRKYFARFVDEQETDQVRRGIAGLFLAWTGVFANQSSAAADADKVIANAAMTPAKRFEAYAVKAWALVGAEQWAEAEKVLDSQAAFLASQQQAMPQPEWQVFNLLAKANLWLRQAIRQADAKEAEAARLGKSPEADKLKAEAQAIYDAAYDKAANFLDSPSGRPSAVINLASAATELLLERPGYKRTVATTQADRVPTKEELAAMSTSAQRRFIDAAWAAKNFDGAMLAGRDLLRKVETGPALDPAIRKQQLADVLESLGRMLYQFAAELEGKDAAAARKHYLEAADTFARLINENPEHGGNGSTIRELLVFSLKKLPAVDTDEALKERYRRALEEFKKSLKGEELAKRRLLLADEFARVKMFRQAAMEYEAVPANHVDYDYARTKMTQLIVDMYDGGFKAPSQEIIQADVEKLKAFEGFGTRRSAELEARADKLEKDPSPDAVVAAERKKEIETLRRRAKALRDLGPEYKLHAAWMQYKLLNNRQAALKDIDAVTAAHKDNKSLQSLALSTRVRIFLDAQEFDKAVTVLMDLIKVDPSGAARDYVYPVLSRLEADFRKTRSEGGLDLVKARQVAQLAEVLVKEIDNRTDLSPQAKEALLVDFRFNLGKALNWCGRPAEAEKALRPIYKEGKTPGPIIIEFADAIFNAALADRQSPDFQAKVNEALNLFSVLPRSEDPDTQFSEDWWRSIIGFYHCRLMVAGESDNVAADWRELRRYGEESVKQNKPVPTWLLSPLADVSDKLKNKAIERGEVLEGGKSVKKETDRPREDRFGKQLLLLGGMAIGGLSLVFGFYYLNLFRRRRARKRAQQAAAAR